MKFANQLSIPTLGCRLFLALIAASACAVHTYASPRAAENNAVQTQMHNVMYHFSSSVAVHIKTLDGQLDPTDPSAYPVFDNKDSFTVAISSAEITITATDLGNVLNSYVFARPKAPPSVSKGIAPASKTARFCSTPPK